MDAYVENLDLFSPSPREIGIVQREWIEKGPESALVDGSPIEFNLPGNNLRYVDLAKTFIYLKIQVFKGDGTVMPQTADVATPG